MKIMLLAAGNDIHAVRWANTLNLNGHEVHLCYCSNHSPRKDKLESGVILHSLKFSAPQGYYLNISEFKKILKMHNPDILNIHYASGYGTLGRMSKFHPTLLSVYGSDIYDFPYKNKLNLSIVRKNLSYADEIASTSNAMANQIRKIMNKDNKEIYITPFGVDINIFCKKRQNSSDYSFVIGSIKKLSPKYGIEYGIKAVAEFVNTFLPEEDLKSRDIKYYIYGEGDEKGKLESLADSLGLQNIVEFKGRIPNTEVPQALNDFDVFLGTSVLDSESFGVAIVEAMACEVPVIVTDVDGFKEVVNHGEEGILVPRKDFSAMASEIANIYFNKNDIRTSLGTKERNRVVENYNWENNVKKMQDIYSYMIRKEYK